MVLTRGYVTANVLIFKKKEKKKRSNQIKFIPSFSITAIVMIVVK